jgi:hypothetical protein
MVGKLPVNAAKFAVTTKTFFFMVINSIFYHISTANGEPSLTCCNVIKDGICVCVGGGGLVTCNTTCSFSDH